MGGGCGGVSSVMDSFVARANIDHYIGLLNDPGLAPENRATVTVLLIQEVDKLRGDLDLSSPKPELPVVANGSIMCYASSI